jgi:S1-C subfamily serine protease
MPWNEGQSPAKRADPATVLTCRLDGAGICFHPAGVPNLLRLLGIGWAVASMAMAAEPERSVIQISVFSQQPAWDAPWRFDSVRRSSGSGLVIRGKRILTNAHVLCWARQVLVRRYQDPRPFLARVLFSGHDCDLAVLEVEDERFFEGLEPLEIGELPAVRSAVVTYGYPTGGEQISYTRGVVSRIELQSYVHIGNRAFLAVQTDAAINPGNSGGPVIQDDKVVGVAFQNTPGLENTGFFIPPPVIQHFLKDIADGEYDGFPQAGIRLSALHNPDFRRYLKLPDDNRGARIDYIYPVGSTQRVLRREDVLLQVGPYAVGSDGTIVYAGNRVHAGVAFGEVQHGETVALKVWRDGGAQDLTLPVYTQREDMAEGNLYTLPKYYIVGGLVFTPLSRDYLRTQGSSAPDISSGELFYELFFRRQEQPETWRPEPIVLATVLAHSVNANLTIRGRALVDRVNGRRITNLNDLVQAFESSPGEQDMIQFVTQDSFECLNHEEARKASSEILATYRIPSDRRL